MSVNSGSSGLHSFRCILPNTPASVHASLLPVSTKDGLAETACALTGAQPIWNSGHRADTRPVTCKNCIRVIRSEFDRIQKVLSGEL